MLKATFHQVTIKFFCETMVCKPLLSRFLHAWKVTSKEEAYMALCMDCHLLNIILLVPYFHFIHHGMQNGSIVDVVVSSSNHIGENALSSHLIFLYHTYTCFVCVLNTWHPCTKTINLWEKQFTKFPLSNRELQSLWCIRWIFILALVKFMTSWIQVFIFFFKIMDI
jgi:hypothetical protein